ncbi:MAG: hypothetical protein COV38_02225 [Bdellovibrionales bacterium CG11_big_fil_rev_8_21_14_0_20_38_13]|nr:MAG: hypothetical protein COV38_02225 [Bdellovibrionales bacterium CG11_big_fil_rev_8_21_14_0_20_38_13]
MNIYFVSDVHIKEDNDEASVLFRKFLDEAKNSDVIVLLGDIFDLVVGGHFDWIEKFPQSFKKISEISKTKKTYFIEGNHDFLVGNLFNHPLMKDITHVSGDLVLHDDEVTIRFSHGDDVEIDNKNYRTYKKLIKNSFTEILANKVVPVSFISKIGNKASKESAKKSRRYSMDESYTAKIHQKFRDSAQEYHQKHSDFSILACGHSHVKDLWIKDDFTYVNNGYFLNEKTYAAIENGVVSFKSLI